MAHQQPATGAVAAAAQWIDRRIKTGDVFILAALISLAPLFLTNSYQWAPRLINGIFFPVAALLWLSFQINWRKGPTLDVSARIVFTFSLILAAVVVYLVAINLSDWRQPGAVLRVLDRQWRYAGQILLFMMCFAYAVRTWPEFLPRFVTAFSTLVAASALYNIVAFLSEASFSSVLQATRMTNVLGMPGYTNSTNVSATYALMFVASVSVILDRRLSWLMRCWLLPVGLILLAGVLLTQSRSAYLSVAVGLGVLSYIAAQTYRRAVIISVVAVTIVILFLLAIVPQTRAVMLFRSDSHRSEIWQTYAGKAVEKPLLGYGGLSNVEIKLRTGTMIDQPHNLVLSAQIRGGIFCALAMITMLLGSLYWSVRFLKLRGEVVPLAMIATIATAGMFDYNLLITPVTWPWVTFWLPFAICAGAEIVVRQCSRPPA